MRVSQQVESNKYKIKCGKSTHQSPPTKPKTDKFSTENSTVNNNNCKTPEKTQVRDGKTKTEKKSKGNGNQKSIKLQDGKSPISEGKPDRNKIETRLSVPPKGCHYKNSKDENNLIGGDYGASTAAGKTTKPEKNCKQISSKTEESPTCSKSGISEGKAAKPGKSSKNPVGSAKTRRFKCGQCKKLNDHYKSTCPENTEKGKEIVNAKWKEVLIHDKDKGMLLERSLLRFHKGPTEDEGEGYIYMYKYTYTGENKKKLEEAKKYENIFKVGMAKDVLKRIGQLEYGNNLDTQHEGYTVIFSWPVKWRIIADHIIKEQLTGTGHFHPNLPFKGGTEWYQGEESKIVEKINSVVRFLNRYAPEF